MKKIAILFLPALFFLGACGQAVNMDEQAKDGNYHYENFDLRFQVVLPPEFEYYQTQRKTEERWTDIEFFIPSNDIEFPQEIPNYWMPLVIRVWNEDDYAATLVPGGTPLYTSFGTKRGYTYTYLFEENLPLDWKDRWSEDIVGFIIENLSIK